MERYRCGCGYESQSNKYYRLGTWYFKTSSTAHVSADQHVVNPNHVVARLLKSHAVLFVGATRWTALLRPLKPTDVIFPTFAAMRTTVTGLLNFLFLVEKILLVHDG